MDCVKFFCALLVILSVFPSNSAYPARRTKRQDIIFPDEFEAFSSRFMKTTESPIVESVMKTTESPMVENVKINSSEMRDLNEYTDISEENSTYGPIGNRYMIKTNCKVGFSFVEGKCRKKFERKF